MDLVRIFHVVDMPSSGKHDFNHIYVVGLILSYFDPFLNQFCLKQFILILFLFWCSCNVHILVWHWVIVSKDVDLCHPFLSVYFLSIFSDIRCCSVELCGFPSFFWCSWMTMMQIILWQYTQRMFIQRSLHTPTS